MNDITSLIGGFIAFIIIAFVVLMVVCGVFVIALSILAPIMAIVAGVTKHKE